MALVTFRAGDGVEAVAVNPAQVTHIRPHTDRGTVIHVPGFTVWVEEDMRNVTIKLG